MAAPTAEQGVVSEDAQATAAEATLTERAQAAARDTTAEEAAKAVAATRPDARDYATGVTTDEEFRVGEVAGPDVITREAKQITDQIDIPTIGIGSSLNCDGQILVTDDMLGISGFYPKFVKKYVSLDRIIEKAVKKYTKDVKLKKFPSTKNFLNGYKYR